MDNSFNSDPTNKTKHDRRSSSADPGPASQSVTQPQRNLVQLKPTATGTDAALQTQQSVLLMLMLVLFPLPHTLCHPIAPSVQSNDETAAFFFSPLTLNTSKQRVTPTLNQEASAVRRVCKLLDLYFDTSRGSYP